METELLGPVLRVTIEADRRSHPVFRSKREENIFYRTAFQSLGEWWIEEYFPLRFNRQYATKALGYELGGRYPFFATGALKKTALRGIRAEARSTTSKGPSVRIRIPAPPYVNYNPKVQAGLRTIPASEIRVLGRVLERELNLQRQSAVVTKIKRGPTAGQARTTLVGATSDIIRAAEERRRLNRQLKLNPKGRRREALKRLRLE